MGPPVSEHSSQHSLKRKRSNNDGDEGSQISRPASSAFSGRTRDKISAKCGNKCWFCESVQHVAAHVILKSATKQFKDVREEGLVTFDSLQYANNAIALCGRCYLAYDDYNRLNSDVHTERHDDRNEEPPLRCSQRHTSAKSGNQKKSTSLKEPGNQGGRFHGTKRALKADTDQEVKEWDSLSGTSQSRIEKASHWHVRNDYRYMEDYWQWGPNFSTELKVKLRAGLDDLPDEEDTQEAEEGSQNEKPAKCKRSGSDEEGEVKRYKGDVGIARISPPPSVP